MASMVRYNRDTAFGLNGGFAHSAGDLVACDSQGRAVKADADTGPLGAIGVVVKDAAAGDSRVTVSDDCEVEFPGLNLTPGGRVFLSGTAGAITQTAPAAAGALRQAVGVALSATRVRFRVVPAQLVVQASGGSTVAFG